MIMSSSVIQNRRQPYLDQAAYDGTIVHLNEDNLILQDTLSSHAGNPLERSRDLDVIAQKLWFRFQLNYTAGASLSDLALKLGNVVGAYEDFVAELANVSDEQYFTPFALDDLIDIYVDYVNLLSCAILLHREDLIPRIYGLIEGTDYDGEDAVIEELFRFFLPDRPALDQWIWDKPYRLLLDAIDEVDDLSRIKCMKKYVKSWYPAMKGQAIFWGKHEKISDDFSPYNGYWAMCSSAFTYLYAIDDASYRNEIVYPKDLVDYARSIPRNPVIHGEGELVLRVIGGDRCVKEGVWFTPAQQSSARHFFVGEIMPIVDSAEYGTTTWQWRST